MPAREIAARLLWMLLAFTLLVGCVPGAPAGAPPQPLAPTDEATATSVLPSLTPSPTATTAPATLTRMPTVPPTVANTPEPTPPATPTAVAPVDAAICTEAPSTYDLRGAFGITHIVRLEFLDEETLLVEGWIPRQFSDTPNDLDAPPWIFREVAINLSTGEIAPIEASSTPLLRSPCATGCQLQALDESPDGSWQLLTAAGGTAGETGTWLVGADSMTRLVDIVPSSLWWEWAADSSLLWLTFNVPEYSTSPMGSFVMAVELGPTVTLVDQEAFSRDYAEPLYQPNYALAFSPAEKQLVTTARNEYFDEPDDRFFTFDASVAPPNRVSTDGPVPGLIGVVWNEATDDFLLVIVGQDGLELRRLDGATLLQAPMSTLAPLYPDISVQLLSGEIELEGFVPRDSYALSADGRRMAIGYGEVNGVVVFDCAVIE